MFIGKNKFKKPSGRVISNHFASGGGGGLFRRRQHFWQLRIFKVWTILGLIVLSFIFYFLFWSGAFKINNIKINGVSAIDPAKIESIVRNQMEQRSWLLLSQSNLFFFDSETAESKIRNAFVLESVQIKKRPLKTLRVEIKEKSTQITWISDNKYYYLDPNGIAIQEILVANVTLVEGSGEVSQNEETTNGGQSLIDLSALNQDLPQVYDLTNARVEIGENILKPEIISFIQRLKDKFSSRSDIKIKYYQVPELQGSEVRVITDRGFDVYFNTSDDLDRQLANLNLIMKEKMRDNKKINYIDLRFGEKVYIK
ncbi:MAG: hypothetical protein WC310_01730 [Patescibacteria group bacterium]|jgi:cell division septal protein FtsQ